MSKVRKKLVVPPSKPRNHLVLLAKKRSAGFHKSDKDTPVSKGKFKDNLRKGIYD